MVDLTTLAERVSPGVDPADLARVAAEWAIDQPEALARVFALADPGSGIASPDLRRFVHQARYGNPRQLPSDQVAAWRDLGFTTEPHDGAPWPEVDIAAPITVPFGRMADAYDLIVVGSGCGAMAAYAASTGGARVLLVEVGTWLGSALIGPDALRNQRVSTGLETPAGPVLTGNPRVAADGETVAATDARWGNNAFIVGGGMRVFGAQAWRFSSEDFRMASTYGVPAGSALADWPISYEDVAPYYSRVERLLGCAGDRTGNPYAGTTEPYPLPPLPMNRSGELLTRAAASLAGRPIGFRSPCRRSRSAGGRPVPGVAPASAFRVGPTPRTAPTTPSCRSRSQPVAATWWSGRAPLAS